MTGTSPAASMCSIQDMDNWGPFTTNPRCSHLSFTLLFEEVVMAITPIACALLLALSRIACLVRTKTKTERTALYMLKLGTLSVVAALELTQICLLALDATPKTRASLAAAIIYFVSSLVFICLSELEHTRSTRPSYVLSAYFLLSCLLDIIRARTLWIIHNATTVAALFTATLLARVTVLALESSQKQRALKAPYKGSSPESTNGIFSLFLLSWLNPLLRTGYKEDLLVTQLFSLRSSISSDILLEETSARWAKANQQKHNSLFLALLGQHKRTVLAGVVARLCLTAFKFAQPFLVEALLNYVDRGSSGSPAEGTWLLVAYAAVYIGIAICQAGYMYQTHRLVAMIRGGLIALLYRKVLDMETKKASKSASVTLMSIDMEKIAYGLQTIHQTWAGVIEIALALWLLERQLGLAVVGSVLVSALCIFGGNLVAVSAGRRQTLWVDASQRRVNVTASMLGRFKSIKLAGYIDILASKISDLRDREVEISKKFRKCLVGIVTLSYASNVGAPILGFGVYALTPSIHRSEIFDSTKAFSSLVIFTLLAQATGSFIQAAVEFMSAASCFERFRQNFPEEWQDRRLHPEKRSSECLPITTDDSGPLENGYNLTTIGSKAQGLNDNGSCVIAHDLSAGWPGNEQILRNQSFTIGRSKFTVVTGGMGSGKSTLLETILGESLISGGTLSANFARAAYCSQTPWLLNLTIRESILGASDFDRSWYNTVIEACALKPDIQTMRAGDQSIIGSEGLQLSGGQRKRLALARAVYSNLDVLILDDVLSGLDPETIETILTNLFNSDGLLRRLNRTVILTTVNSRALLLADEVIKIDRDGRLSQHTASQKPGTNAKSGSNAPETLASWSSSPQEGLSSNEQVTSLPDSDLYNKEIRNRGDLQVYRYYVSMIGRRNALVFLACCVGVVLGFYIPQIWIALWTRANETGTGFGSAVYLGVYVAFGVFALISLISGGLQLMMRIVPRSAQALHRALLCAVMEAPVSFLTDKDAGETVNRFSQDLTIIDTDVPITVFTTIFSLLTCITQAVFVCVSSRYIAAGTPLFLIMFYMVQRYYLRTSRQLRVIDIETKAPLISQFLDTLRGLTTIRSYGLGKNFEARLIHKLDLSQRPFYLLYCIQVWLGLVLELSVAAIAVILVAITVGVRGSPTAGLLGVALTSIVNFAANLNDLVINWTNLETAIQALSRIQSFALHTPSEHKPGEDYTPPGDWPLKGQIAFKNVRAAYSGSAGAVLEDVSFVIQGSQKIGICGRSGSGKSSLLATLNRILELDDGLILIDGIDIGTIPRRHLRSKIMNVPQDPFVAPGSIRDNIDPWNARTDSELIAALEAVCLWGNLDDKGGLEADASKMSFSIGQLQLLSLARLLVQQGKIVVMDEVASHLDAQTDELIRGIIRQKFQHHTVITVAHNLEHLLDCDKVMVIDQGRVVEFDTPENLIFRLNSRFNLIFQ